MMQEAMKLPEAERLQSMDRFDDYSHFWAVSLARFPAAGPELKDSLTPPSSSSRWHRELAYLGQGAGYAWYAYAPIYEWIEVQRKLKLAGGDGAPAAAFRGLTIEDEGSCTRNSCIPLLAQAGADAVPYLDKVLAWDSPLKATVIYGMGTSSAPQVTEWLLRHADSPDHWVARGVRLALVCWPRKEATALYLKWLPQPYEEDVVQGRLMEACKAVKAPGVAAILPRLLAAPHTLHEYRPVYEWWREVSGRPFAGDVLAQEERIRDQVAREHNVRWDRAGEDTWRMVRLGPAYDQKEVDAAVVALVKSDDPDAAAAVALDLLTFGGKETNEMDRRIRAAAVAILRGLPEPSGRALIARLAETVRSEPSREMLKRIGAELNAAPPGSPQSP